MRIWIVLVMGAIVGVMFVMLMLQVIRIGASMFLADLYLDPIDNPNPPGNVAANS